MLLAQAFTWLEWGLLATVLVCTAIVVSRAFAGTSAPADPVDDEAEHAETTAARRVGNLEVRLHDFSREVEARLEKRAVELDALVAAADREIARLGELVKSASAAKDSRGSEVARSSAPARAGSNVPAAHEQMICHLHDAGYSVSEIAHMVGRPPEAVSTVLKAA